MLANLFTAIVGGVFRRWWGGWHVPSHWVKLVVGFLLAFLSGLHQTENLYAALAVGAIIGASFLNPLHAWGMGMGYSAQDIAAKKTTWQCIAVMGASYGAYTVAAALLAWLLAGQIHLGMAASGFLVPFPYLVAADFYNRHPEKFPFLKIAGEWFIDSPTAIGECFLGALLLVG